MNFDVFISNRWCYQVEVFMLQHMYLAPGIEIVLLTMSFDVVMSAVGVLKSPA